MTNEYGLCDDPNCKGCRWYERNAAAIEKRMKPPKEKPEPKARERDQ